MTQASQGTVIWAVVIATIVLLLASLFVAPSMIGSKIGDVDVPTADEIAASVLAGIDIPEGLDNAKLDELYEDHFKDDVWEDTALALAIAELEDDDYEVIIDENAISGLDDEDDIVEVKIKDSEVGSGNYFDEEDENAAVWLKLRVYYDTATEDDVIETVYSRIVIEDGEVEDVNFGYQYNIF